MSYSPKLLIAVILDGVILGGTLILSGTVAGSALRAQEASPSHPQLAAAFALENAGRPEAAIAAAQSLIDSRSLTPFDRAQALDLEGISYEDLDEPEKAMHALEEAAHLLRPQDNKQLAAVFNNMANVYRAWGHFTIAEYLYERAFQQAKAVAEHGDMARAANNQASLALAEKRNRVARKYLQRSDREARQATDLDDDDRAGMASMHGWLAWNKGHTTEALQQYRQALELWRRKHGGQHESTAWGMLLAGQAEARAGDRDAGLRTMREGFALTAAIEGEKSHRYAVAELAYARLLGRAGNRIQAAVMQQDAQTRLAVFENRSCRDCTISAMALH
jgi:tetratricopeptide (TPR) repeat protein